MLERKHVAFYARSSKVREEVAERDIILTYVLRILSDSILPQLAFKGGTCLKKTYFGKTGRFSMDLDFTSISVKLEDLRNKLKQSLHNKTVYGIDFKIIEENVGTESYLAVVRYAHAWNPGSEFELQVSYREQPLLPTVELPLIEEMYFKFCEFQSFSVKCMRKDELLAEKIRAAFQRVRSRDLYDLYLFTKRHYDKDIVKTLAVIKCWNARDPFNPEILLDRVAKVDYNWEDLQRLVRKGSLPSQGDVLKTVLKNYAFLRELSDPLTKIIEDSKAHSKNELVASLLSDLRARKNAHI
jgi:predicted nucleotidyltransferase component of viral defense system